MKVYIVGNWSGCDSIELIAVCDSEEKGEEIRKANAGKYGGDFVREVTLNEVIGEL